MSEYEYTLSDQLSELSNRILFVLLCTAAVAGVIFVFIDPLVDQLFEAGPDVPVVFITPPEIFLIKIKVTLLAALLVAFPLIAVEICLFIFPSFYRRERIITAGFFIATLLCAGGGVLFAYVSAVPSVLGFLSGFTHPSIQAMYDFQLYIGFILGIVFFFPFIFETPLVFLFLGKMGVVSSSDLRTVRKYMYLLLFLLSALLTPSDPVSMLLLGAPLVLLYELGILLVALVYRKRVG